MKNEIVVSFLALAHERSQVIHMYLLFFLALTAFTYLTVFDFLRYFP